MTQLKPILKKREIIFPKNLKWIHRRAKALIEIISNEHTGWICMRSRRLLILQLISPFTSVRITQEERTFRYWYELVARTKGHSEDSEDSEWEILVIGDVDLNELME